MMDKPIKGDTRFKAYTYRAYTPNFGQPLKNGKIPGPLIEANVGETIAVHFQNKLKVPVTMHPHGVFYSEEMDGAYKGKYTDPGGFVQPGQTFTYIWDARPGTEGSSTTTTGPWTRSRSTRGSWGRSSSATHQSRALTSSSSSSCTPSSP